MRPVEPLTSWFRAMGLAGRDAKTMKACAYTALMLFHFLATRSRDFVSASEADLLEFRLWRREQAEETVGQAAWDRDSAALGQLYDYLVQRGQVPGRPWRPTGRTASLGSGASRDLRVRHMELEQYTCSCCGAQHPELPMNYTVEAPAVWNPAFADADDCLLFADQCVVREQHYFVKDMIEIPVIGSDEVFSWGVCISLSGRLRKSFGG
ncbi:DUF2199 domain-containing protein [Streptomyces sp. NPDC102437]|uniref:DUF2199 domain-containing protein n=1 Tax=Streptomyces sp. NPDC102437 TaxID=3366175 RepID=UPI00381B3BFD